MSNRDVVRNIARRLIAQGWDPVDAALEATRLANSDEAQAAQAEQDEAYRQMMASETRDPTGLFSEGGLSAGGIFGEGVVALGDHDSSARRRGIETRAQMAGVEQTLVMRQLLSMQQTQAQTQRLLFEQQRALQAAQDKLRLLESSSSPAEDPWSHPERGRRKRR